MSIIEERLTTPGERLKRARLLAGLETREMAERIIGISKNTLQGWEQNKNPLSKKGAETVTKKLKSLGWIISPDWLLRGNGLPPRSYEMLNTGIKEPERHDLTFAELNLKEEERIYQETQLFNQQYPNSIVLTVIDNAMEPFYSIGDYVGGTKLYGEDIKKCLGKTCIVELENHAIIPRFLQAGNQEGQYSICCSNYKTTAAAPLVQFNTKILSTAPILWHRRKLSAF